MSEGVNEGKRFPRLEKFLDEQKTKLVRAFYRDTGVPTGNELRKVVKQLGGEWNCSQRTGEYYDTLKIPYKRGTLIIRRPWIDTKNLSWKGHRVIFYGEAWFGLEMSLKGYLHELHELEKEKTEYYLNHRKLSTTAI